MPEYYGSLLVTTSQIYTKAASYSGKHSCLTRLRRQAISSHRRTRLVPEQPRQPLHFLDMLHVAIAVADNSFLLLA